MLQLAFGDNPFKLPVRTRGEITPRIDELDERLEIYGLGGALIWMGGSGAASIDGLEFENGPVLRTEGDCGSVGDMRGVTISSSWSARVYAGISTPNSSVIGRGGARSTIASRSCRNRYDSAPVNATKKNDNTSRFKSSPAYSPSISSGPRSI